LTATAAQVVGDVTLVDGGAHAALVADVSRGRLVLAPDGSFTYRPDPGYVGADSFRYVLVLGDRTSQAVEVDLAIYRWDVPSASPRDDFAIGSTAGGGPNSPNVSFGSLGPLAFSFEWLIPSLVVSVPGFLVVVVIGIQLLVGAAWLPLVRRDLGDFGLRFRRRRRGAAQA
jgi:hypothetical protein